MIKGGYHLAKVKPTIDVLGNIAYDAGDVLFDWYKFEIPKGGCALKTLNVIHPGTNGVAVAGLDIELIFATTVNGIAPPSLGDPDDAITLIKATAVRNHIIGHKYLDGSGMENSDELGSYNIWTNTTGNADAAAGTESVNIILEGDPTYAGNDPDIAPYHTATTPGYQAIWMAAIAVGTDDFGTGVTLNQAGHQAISTVPVDLIVTGTDADDVFAIGDELISFVAANGSKPSIIGTVTSIPDADSIIVDAVAEQFDHTTEICFRRPLTFNLGFEY